MDEKSIFREILGKNIRRIRCEQSLTVENLANQSGMSYSQVSRIELGKLNPTAYTLFILSKTLNVCPSEFFKDQLRTPKNLTV